MPIIYPASASPTSSKYLPSFRMLDGGFGVVFKTLTALLASTLPRVGAESVWEAGGFRYIEADPGATDHHLTTAGGVKLYVVPLYGPDLPLYPLSAFGAAMDGETDDTQPWLTALRAIQQGGGGSLLIRGIARVTEAVTISDWTRDVTLVGSDAGSDGIYLSTGDTQILRGTAAAPMNLRMENIQLRGPWAEDPKESAVEAWLVDVFGLRSLVTISCTFRSSQKGLVKARAEDSAESWYCTYEEAARGAWNMTGSKNTKFIGNTVRHVRDDAVSLHFNIGASDPNIGQHIVSSNYFQDCQGIAAMGARNLVVSNNVGILMRTRFCVVGVDASYGEGYVTPLNILIGSNLVQDILNYSFFEGSGNNNYYTYIYPVTPSDGGTLAGIPGERAAGGGIVPLYGNLTGVGEGAAFALGQAITIHHNKFMRTQAADVPYSSYGFGTFITPDGYMDASPTDSDLSGECRFRSGLRDFDFSANFLQGVKYGVFLDFSNGSVFRNGRISDNTFRDTRQDCIDTNASGSGNVLDLRFDDNTIDGDPFYVTPGRGPDGSFASESAMTAFNLPNTTGWSGSGNKVFNCSRVELTSNATRNWHGRNYQYGRCASAGFSTGNRGIGRPAAAAHGWWLVDYQADTTQADFGQIGQTVEVATAQPTGGYWLEGMFLENIAASAYQADAGGNLLAGWMRRTTGNAHAAGTDWLPVYRATQPA